MCKEKRNWSYNVTLVLMRQQVLYVLRHENTAQFSILIYVFMKPHSGADSYTCCSLSFCVRGEVITGPRSVLYTVNTD